MTPAVAFDKAVEQLLDADPSDRLRGQLDTLRRLFVAELDSGNRAVEVGHIMIAMQRAVVGDAAFTGNQDQEIAWAAACYAAPGILLRPRNEGSSFSERTIPALCDPWPWETGDERMARPINPWHREQQFRQHRVAELALAGALCVTEIDRLQHFWAGDDEREAAGHAA